MLRRGAALAADYVAGLTTIQLMTKYDLSKGSVLKLLAEAGVETRRRALSPDQVSRAVARYEAGLAIREVATELGLPKTTVQDALRNAGVQMRSATRRPKLR